MHPSCACLCRSDLAGVTAEAAVLCLDYILRVSPGCLGCFALYCIVFLVCVAVTAEPPECPVLRVVCLIWRAGMRPAQSRAAHPPPPPQPA